MTRIQSLSSLPRLSNSGRPASLRILAQGFCTRFLRTAEAHISQSHGYTCVFSHIALCTYSLAHTFQIMLRTSSRARKQRSLSCTLNESQVKCRARNSKTARTVTHSNTRTLSSPLPTVCKEAFSVYAMFECTTSVHVRRQSHVYLHAIAYMV